MTTLLYLGIGEFLAMTTVIGQVKGGGDLETNEGVQPWNIEDPRILYTLEDIWIRTQVPTVCNLPYQCGHHLDYRGKYMHNSNPPLSRPNCPTGWPLLSYLHVDSFKLLAQAVVIPVGIKGWTAASFELGLQQYELCGL